MNPTCRPGPSLFVSFHPLYHNMGVLIHVGVVCIAARVPSPDHRDWRGAYVVFLHKTTKTFARSTSREDDLKTPDLGPDVPAHSPRTGAARLHPHCFDNARAYRCAGPHGARAHGTSQNIRLYFLYWWDPDPAIRWGKNGRARSREGSSCRSYPLFCL